MKLKTEAIVEAKKFFPDVVSKFALPVNKEEIYKAHPSLEEDALVNEYNYNSMQFDMRFDAEGKPYILTAVNILHIENDEEKGEVSAEVKHLDFVIPSLGDMRKLRDMLTTAIKEGEFAKQKVQTNIKKEAESAAKMRADMDEEIKTLENLEGISNG